MGIVFVAIMQIHAGTFAQRVPKSNRNVWSWLAFYFCVINITDDDCLSLASELAGDEGREDEEIEAAAQHLNQEFISQVLPEFGQGEQGDQERSKETTQMSGRSPHVPLKTLLGPLPSAASLGLTDTIRECITENTTTGEWDEWTEPLLHQHIYIW